MDHAASSARVTVRRSRRPGRDGRLDWPLAGV